MDNNIGKSKADKHKNAEEKGSMPVFVKYGLIALAAVVVIVAGVIIYLTTAGSNVATVGSEKIGLGEFTYYLDMQKQTMLTEAQKNDPSIDATKFWSSKINGENALEVAKKKALDSLKGLKIQIIKAKENKITLSSDDLKNIDSTIQQQIITPLGSGNKIKASAALKAQSGITLDEFTKMYKDYTLVSKYQQGEMSKIKVADTEIKSYYDKHPDWYKEDTQMRLGGEEAVWARHILITAAKDATQEVKDAAKKKAQGLLDQLKAGADFITLAKANSEDGNAQYGGDYLFGKGKMVPEFEKVAFALTPGQLNPELVQTDYGYHIIKLDEKYAKDQPVSLKCATEYREYGTGFIKSKLYQEKLDTWKSDPKYEVVKTAAYNAITK